MRDPFCAQRYWEFKGARHEEIVRKLSILFQQGRQGVQFDDALWNGLKNKNASSLRGAPSGNSWQLYAYDLHNGFKPWTRFLGQFWGPFSDTKYGALKALRNSWVICFWACFFGPKFGPTKWPTATAKFGRRTASKIYVSIRGSLCKQNAKNTYL